MTSESTAATSRFEMVKERHQKTFENSVKKKAIDKKAISICGFLNSQKDYFTSSSCAGRIVLLGVPKGEDKQGSYFHRKWHRKVSFKELWESLNADASIETAEFTPERRKKFEGKIGSKNDEIWFKLDAFIFHFGCSSLEKANRLISAIQEAGIKRYGITVAKQGKFMIEITGTQNIAIPVKKGNKIFIDREYMKTVLEFANKKLQKNYKQLERFEKELKKGL